MSICKNCPSTKNGQCVCTDSCVIKKEQDRIAKFYLYYLQAITSTSIKAPFGNFPTSTALLAGNGSTKYVA